MHRVITFTIGLVAFVIPSLAAADTVRRFDGLWANEAHGCRLYMSKKLENDDRLDMSTRRSFGLTEIRDGNIQLIYQKVSCLIAKATPINSSDVALIAACDMRGNLSRETGLARFSGESRLQIQLGKGYLSLDVVRCSR